MSDMEKLTFLARAIWPNGFWCDHCSYRYDYPWMFVDRCKNGWRAQCPNCGTQTSLTDDRIRILMRAGCEAVRRVFLVCQVWKVSLLDVLKKPTKHSNQHKPTKMHACATVRRVMIREVYDVMLEQEVSTLFSVSARDVRASVSAKTEFVDIWKTALEQRKKERLRRERKRQHSTRTAGSSSGSSTDGGEKTQVEYRQSDGSDSEARGRSGRA